MNTLHRLKMYIDHKGISVKKFEESVGFSNGSFASQLKNNKTIGVDRLENILLTYPDINPDWLLTGRGDMIRTEQTKPLQTQPLKDNKLELEMIRELSAENALLKAKMEKLRKEKKANSS